MQKINWDMMTQFVFPEQLGVIEEVVSVDIKPIWQQIETEDSVRLVGIYHIAAVARFNPDELPEYNDGTFIEELEFEGNNGYFEYALPLEIDLPREKIAFESSPQVSINDISHFVYDGSNCTFKWDVDCQFDESVEGALFQYEQQTPIELEQPPLPEKPVLQEIAPVVSEETPEIPVYEQQDMPQIEVAPIHQDLQPKEESPNTEEIRFGGTDGIFPEQSTVNEEQPPQQEEQSLLEEVNEEEQSLLEEVSEAEHANAILEKSSNQADESPSFKAETKYDLSDDPIVENVAEEKIDEPKLEKINIEKVVEARNQYFPTDTDDFYNELTESYTILNVSNKIYRD
ncbi:hypothetical protein [Ureibacillus sp. GCM10028918]|uniref:hypothetical protein n=1 Tax=Ureibacillus sp. GCM10028918 TaxID=3273429 RepID=UPI0036170A2B